MKKMAQNRLKHAKIFLMPAVCTTLILASWSLTQGATYSQLALGGGYECVLIVTNQSDLIWQGRAQLRGGGNQSWPASWGLNGVEQFGSTSFEINLSAKGTAKYVLSGDAMARAGYLVLESTGASLESQIVVSFFYNFRDSRGKLQDSTATMTGPPSRRFLFPVEKSAQVDTGLAWAPSEFEAPFDIVVTLRDQDGSEVDRVTLTYEGHLARFFSQIFEVVPETFLGSVSVEAAQKLHLTVLRMEFSEASAFQLTSIFPQAMPDVVESDNIALLDFRVQDAEYSKRLDRIIMVASDRNQLHIYDPVREEDTAVDLPLVGSSVSVSPNGAYAAVGHNAWISYVNLETATLDRTLPVSTDVLDIVLAGNGWAYAFPRRDQWTNIFCINIATAEQTIGTGSIYAGTVGKLHPGGTALYGANNGLSPSDIEKYDISDGTARYLYDSPYHGDHEMCGDLWLSEDGLRIFTRCGNVFRSSEVREQDMLYNGSLAGLNRIEHLSHSSILDKVLAIPESLDWPPGATGAEDTEVQAYNYQFLGFENRFTLPEFVVNNNSYRAHGRFVFFSSDSSRFFVVVQADLSSGMLKDFGVVTSSSDLLTGLHVR